MSKATRYLTTVVSTTLGMRLFSMSIIIPFLSVYALNIEGGTPALIGYALGIFGLTQSILQVPFGMLSDRIGYKRMMIAGLLMLIAGLLTAAYATNIYGLIFARALQGSGAIVTVGYSWISSVASNEDRNRELTRLGAVLGTFTMLSYTLGPLLHIFLNVSQMFIFSAGLIFCCLIWLMLATKQVNPEKRKQFASSKTANKSVFNRENMTMGLMLTVNNLLMMAFFYMLPLLLNGILETNQMWMILTPAILVSVGLLPLFSKLAVSGKAYFLIIFLYLLEGIGFLLLHIQTFAGICIGTILLMSGAFSISTIVPMLANKEMDNKQRGTGNGIIVSLQYFGSFLGAAVTGIFWGISPDIAFLFTAISTGVGIILVLTFPRRKKRLESVHQS
ncbi:MAG TPA: MFS transporter [Prolixibacteraceae bacterium]|nr:MFS transporter [Prolixibacteraceae bacterium]